MIAEKYKKVAVIEEGSFGVVYRCVDVRSGDGVAIKEIQYCDREVAQREIDSLRALQHENIVRMFESFSSDYSYYLVLEDGGRDLKQVMDAKNGVPLAADEIRLYMRQILEGVKFIHEKGYVHRDIKPSNIMVDEKNVIRIIDFGVCNKINEDREQPFCCTYQYIPIDYLMGFSEYSEKLDIWSVGCVFAEMLTGGVILFNGEGQIAIINRILEVLGTPKKEDWPEIDKIDYFRSFDLPEYEQTIKNVVQNQTKETYDLLLKMLNPSDSKRISAKEALEHPYFK